MQIKKNVARSLGLITLWQVNVLVFAEVLISDFSQLSPAQLSAARWLNLSRPAQLH